MSVWDLAYEDMVDSGLHRRRDDRIMGRVRRVGHAPVRLPHNFARWLVHNRNDAEDLVQETYLKALRSFTIV